LLYEASGVPCVKREGCIKEHKKELFARNKKRTTALALNLEVRKERRYQVVKGATSVAARGAFYAELMTHSRNTL
jgi:hypothetical protein